MIMDAAIDTLVVKELGRLFHENIIQQIHPTSVSKLCRGSHSFYIQILTTPWKGRWWWECYADNAQVPQSDLVSSYEGGVVVANSSLKVLIRWFPSSSSLLSNFLLSSRSYWDKKKRSRITTDTPTNPFKKCKKVTT